MKISAQNGTVTLPNGCTIDADCTQNAFRESVSAAGARSWDCGTLPWIYYSFQAGEVDGSDLGVTLCFYDQLLVNINLAVCLYPPDQRDWAHYSLDIEAAQKSLHERILREQFGKPSIGARLLSSLFPGKQDTLNQRVDWHFKWGEVSSCHDSKGGSTFILVRFGDRMEEATAAYLSRQ